MTARSHGFIAVFAILASGMLAGCGGGSGGNAPAPSSSATGRLQVTLQWASGARQVPRNARSVRLNILHPNGSLLQSRLFVRPETGTVASSELFELPQGTWQFQAQAFAGHDGLGTPLAQFQTKAEVMAGQSDTLSLTLGSTIARVKILPDDIPFTGAPVTIHAVALDAAGNTVLTDQWEWSNSHPGVLHMTATGSSATLTGVGPGSTTITVQERESGKTTERVFHVAPLIP
jgi:hypothetical protein